MYIYYRNIERCEKDRWKKMGLDNFLEVVFDNQSDKADVLFKNLIFFLLNSKMDFFWLLHKFFSFQLEEEHNCFLSKDQTDFFFF